MPAHCGSVFFKPVMIDTNSINQFSENAQVVKTQVQANWPFICAAAVLIRTELKNFNAWCVGVAEFFMRHGGVVLVLKKVLWNPDADHDPLK